MDVRFVKTIPTPDSSVFYSLRAEEFLPVYTAHYRLAYDARIIGRCVLSADFEPLRDNGAVAVGEDPRCFRFAGRSYVQDNTWGASALLDEWAGYAREALPSNGKNYTMVPLEEGGRLLCIEWLSPLTVWERAAEPGGWRLLCRQAEGGDPGLRGGTPGYPLGDGRYYGFGHETRGSGWDVRHVPFSWTLDLGGEVPIVRVAPLAGFRSTVADPTCVVERAGTRFLITAESDRPWFVPQSYRTNVYGIGGPKRQKPQRLPTTP
jgi:hypothetical protein